VAWQPDMAAAFTEEPLSFGSHPHQFEIVALNAIWASDGV